MNALRSSSIAIVLLSFLMSTQGVLLMYGVFLLNQDGITEHLCVNRDRPEITCEGICFLKERMEAHHDHHGDDQPDAALPVLPGIAGLVVPPVHVPDAPVQERPALSPEGDWALSDGDTRDIFRPPRTV
ncbi:MAG: hypothetical protein AAF170_01915 [Bacteroidota bacterium]